MSKKPVVWVVQEGRNDYAPAEEFGEVRFITHFEVTSIEGSQQNKNVEADIRKWATEYTPGLDWIVPTGNPMVVALLTMCLHQQMAHKFLKYDGRRICYVPHTLRKVK